MKSSESTISSRFVRMFGHTQRINRRINGTAQRRAKIQSGKKDCDGFDFCSRIRFRWLTGLVLRNAKRPVAVVCLFVFFNSAPILNEILLPSSLIVWIESHQVGHDTHTNETCSVQPIEILSRNHSEHVLSCKWRKILGGNRHRSENQRRLNVLNGNSVFFCFIAIKMKKKHERIHYTTGIGIQVPIGVNKNHCYRNFVYCSCSLRYWISCRRADRLKLSDHRLHPIFFLDRVWFSCSVSNRAKKRKEKKKKTR